ncbi:MAG: NAD(P)H-dependent oxidoreductase [Actinomycetota bacterium]|nr:NAD(P)H-dependent oxidoreductase [Actinomycetota bacterium]MDA2970981.1 NAD(P)H-dependent oxidoreductase [Actinomycetota bacterium]MDA3001976.1 NAD(P)H-dependent oxidoreductase [Actinomycetota bacterium]
MHATILLAHPDPESFAHAIARRAIVGLESTGWTVDLIDLEAIDYAGALSPDEWRAYATDDPVLDDTVRRHTDLIRRTDALIFVYPTWWSSVPAVLKSWLERTLVPGVAFALEGPNNRLVPKLTNLRHVVGITTYGSPWWYVKLVNDAGRRTISRTVGLLARGHAARRWIALHSLDSRSNEQRQRFLERVEREMASLR